MHKIDAFTEGVLARARQRQRHLKGPLEELNMENKAVSEPNLMGLKETSPSSSRQFVSDTKLHGVELSSSVPVSDKTTTVLTSDSQQKTINIQKENLNMEIKVATPDDVRLEVHIEEQQINDSHQSDNGILRQQVRNKLCRLGALYSDSDDVTISSPIQRTEDTFQVNNNMQAEESAGCTATTTMSCSNKGFSKLADLANTINQWVDETQKPKLAVLTARKSNKAPAPQPPVRNCNDSVKAANRKGPAPSIPVPSSLPQSSNNDANAKSIRWDKSVLDSLENQGFVKTASSSRLIYKYNDSKESVSNQPQALVDSKEGTASTVASKRAMFEASPVKPTVKEKDPSLLTLSERRALFERNKGEALLPIAPLATSIPLCKSTSSTTTERVEKKIGGIATTVAELFDAKSTISQQQIETSIKQQRQQDMDIVLNRYNRNAAQTLDTIRKCDNSLHASKEQVYEEEDVDYEEEEDTSETTVMLQNRKEKPIIVQTSKTTDRSCHNEDDKGDISNVAAVLSDVKRIRMSPRKDGRLYPCLSDIETANETETEDAPSPVQPYSSDEEADSNVILSDEDNSSFDDNMLNAGDAKNISQGKMVKNDKEFDAPGEASVSLECNMGPTPPKHCKMAATSNSFNYKSFPENSFQSPMKTAHPRRSSVAFKNLPTHVVDGANVLPLKHSVSMYRKQQASGSATESPHGVIRRPGHIESERVSTSSADCLVTKKIVKLKDDIRRQEMTISQTSRALNLCLSTAEFMVSTEQVEADRVLLLATHRRQSALHEIQRLEIENTLRPVKQIAPNVPVEKGTLVISNITLPLKEKYVHALTAAGGKGHHILCLVKCDEQVVASQLVSTVASPSIKLLDLELHIPGIIKVPDMYSDFSGSIEVYCLQAQEELLPHDLKYHIGKKGTPKKYKPDSKLQRPIQESPAGPQSVRSSSFALVGYAVFSLQQALEQKFWTLNNTPSLSPLVGNVQMNVTCELMASVEHRAFLTMFEDVSGFGAWHRRWCLLKGYTFSYWKYPDDEKKMPPIDSIDLRQCITKQVGPVARDICARMHTFLLERERDAHSYDKDTLVVKCEGDTTVIRHLLSADTKDERIIWCEKFNATLRIVHMWTNKM